MKTILKFPKGPLYTAMWAQVSGLADCCGAGVIGRISGQQLTNVSVTATDIPVMASPYKPFSTMLQYVIKLLPTNKLFSGPPEYLYWALLETLLEKGQNGTHVGQILASNVSKHTFDFEGNPYHKFWASPGMRVKVWSLTDTNKVYMGNTTGLRVSTFLDFVKKQKLGYVQTSELMPGAYGTQKIFGGWYSPDFAMIKAMLPTIIQDANAVCSNRWDIVAPYAKKTKPINDKVAKSW